MFSRHSLYERGQLHGVHTGQLRDYRTRTKKHRTTPPALHSIVVILNDILWREKAQRAIATPPSHSPLIINHHHKMLWTILHTEDKFENMCEETVQSPADMNVAALVKAHLNSHHWDLGNWESLGECRLRDYKHRTIFCLSLCVREISARDVQVCHLTYHLEWSLYISVGL